MAGQEKEQKNKELQQAFKAYAPTKAQFAEHGCNMDTAEEFLETEQGAMAARDGVGYVGATQEELNKALDIDKGIKIDNIALALADGGLCGAAIALRNPFLGSLCLGAGTAVGFSVFSPRNTDLLNEEKIKLAYQEACHEALGVSPPAAVSAKPTKIEKSK